MLLERLGIHSAVTSSASVHAFLLDGPPEPVVTIDDDEGWRSRHFHLHARGGEARQDGKRQAQTPIRTVANHARKQRRGCERGLDQVLPLSTERAAVNFDATILRALQP